MDVDYVEQMAFTTDFYLFFGVLKTVITGKNVYREEIGQEKE